ncbi:DNA-binding MarR family transcriptional regulator [Saccharothrix tamanrassetensis]|uniref:DNA-binding MarR family transcriptional regulator n=1 Tax=Saccharothrix tamanrassetensis TaxID=1051531 RepID=A0A841C9Y2_9PSEU|nr:MarR family transcriptional regulator [Saccharothrix tamanrassetensis]MBB5953753.1 DNA-binding MarR family transcriptional regulator [Saccharothrix tamanrassetensis]
MAQDDRRITGEIAELVDDGFFAWMATWKAQSLAARRIENVMRDRAGLSLTWGEVLSRLGAADDNRLTMNELARQVFVSRSGISQVVTAMAKQGLVERRGDPDNLRITYAVLTDHGRAVLRNSTTTFLEAIREHFARHLSPDEARAITDAMNRVTRILGGTPETPDTTSAIENLHRVVGADPEGAEHHR